MTGLASTSCKRGVIWKINMAYDVLYNEVGPNNAVVCRTHNNVLLL